MELALKFGGFYHSIHKDLIDCFIERDHDFDSEQEQEIDDHYGTIDLSKMYLNYCIKYLKELKSFLKENEVEVDFKFVKLESPEYHNYSTDIIIVEMKHDHQIEVINFVNKNYHEELIEYVKDLTTSYDGYIALYKYEAIMDNKDNKLVEACLTLLAKKINKDIYNRIEELDIEYLN